jgi:predicted nucleotidyltransferase
MSESVNHGLPDSTIQALGAVFSRHPGIRQALLYGSRAKGNFRPGSDIDLTLIAPHMDLAELLRIETEIEELLLPYRVDLSLLHRIENPDLLEHIRRAGVAFP